ncbi:hypothetical protein RchiOBHm_Chr5g0055081 [Rosa chinensis]|uniref:Uncharacterized protein n=1 Tax=Rosa chinensis TaxID=74649 RepID=A0A2P6QGA2_ROSCH|nr:hypothetical protein RchiOBHm_Chr5g0055081 [Rosa chinensis]
MVLTSIDLLFRSSHDGLQNQTFRIMPLFKFRVLSLLPFNFLFQNLGYSYKNLGIQSEWT